MSFAILRDGKTVSRVPLLFRLCGDGKELIFWSYNDFNFFIEGSNTGVVIDTPVCDETVKECFDRMTISVED